MESRSAGEEAREMKSQEKLGKLGPNGSCSMSSLFHFTQYIFRIFISDVLPGPAFGNLVVGDIILKINGIDMTKAEKPQATTILKGLGSHNHVLLTSLLRHNQYYMKF